MNNLTVTGTEQMQRELARRIVDGVRAMRDEAEREVRIIYVQASDSWPVRTGASKARLAWSVEVTPETVEARVWHDTTPQTAYTRFIRIGGGAMHPVRREVKTIDVTRNGKTYQQRRLMRVRQNNAPKYAVTELLGRPWRAMQPRLLDRWVDIFAEAMSDK